MIVNGKFGTSPNQRRSYGWVDLVNFVARGGELHENGKLIETADKGWVWNMMSERWSV